MAQPHSRSIFFPILVLLPLCLAQRAERTESGPTFQLVEFRSVVARLPLVLQQWAIFSSNWGEEVMRGETCNVTLCSPCVPAFLCLWMGYYGVWGRALCQLDISNRGWLGPSFQSEADRSKGPTGQTQLLSSVRPILTQVTWFSHAVDEGSQIVCVLVCVCVSMYLCVCLCQWTKPAIHILGGQQPCVYSHTYTHSHTCLHTCTHTYTLAKKCQ